MNRSKNYFYIDYNKFEISHIELKYCTEVIILNYIIYIYKELGLIP